MSQTKPVTPYEANGHERPRRDYSMTEEQTMYAPPYISPFNPAAATAATLPRVQQSAPALFAATPMIELVARLFASADCLRTVAFLQCGSSRTSDGLLPQLQQMLASELKRSSDIDTVAACLARLDAEASPTHPSRSLGAPADRDIVLVDAPPVERSPALLRLLPRIDGVVLLVEAGVTRTKLLQRTIDTVAAAQGRVLGSVLLNRTYPIPAALYRLVS